MRTRVHLSRAGRPACGKGGPSSERSLFVQFVTCEKCLAGFRKKKRENAAAARRRLVAEVRAGRKPQAETEVGHGGPGRPSAERAFREACRLPGYPEGFDLWPFTAEAKRLAVAVARAVREALS